MYVQQILIVPSTLQILMKLYFTKISICNIFPEHLNTFGNQKVMFLHLE